MPLTPSASDDRQTEQWGRRASRQRTRYLEGTTRRIPHAALLPSAQHMRMTVCALPSRIVLHLLTGLLIPIAAILSQVPLITDDSTAAPRWRSGISAEGIIVPVAPLSLEASAADAPVPDSAFSSIDALPIRGFDRSLLDVRPVPATIIAESANVRGGPGTDYDRVTLLPYGSSIQLLASADDWFKAQLPDGRVVWVLSELFDADPNARDLLPEATGIPAPPPPKVGTVIESGLNLRDGPGTNYVGMQTLSDGTSLELIARFQAWLQVETPDGQIGWVNQLYLTIDPAILDRVEVVTAIPDPNPELVASVDEGRVNLRGGPGTGYEKLGTLEPGTTIDLLARSKDWLKIRTPRGNEGWVSSEVITVSSFVTRRVPITNRVPALPIAQRAPRAGIRAPIQFEPASATSGPVQFALQFVGSPYVWGAASPERGFDCSGFTKYVFAQYGLSLPHSSVAQYSTRYGAAINDPSNLQPGDIVFFVNTYKPGISHVGIYIGGGDVVQALTPGLGVGIANLNERYWASRYYGAIRPRL